MTDLQIRGGTRRPAPRSRRRSSVRSGGEAEDANVADFLLSPGEDDALALVDGTRRLSYRDLRRAAKRVGGELDALGLEPGARVALVGPNSAFWVAAYL